MKNQTSTKQINLELLKIGMPLFVSYPDSKEESVLITDIQKKDISTNDGTVWNSHNANGLLIGTKRLEDGKVAKLYLCKADYLLDFYNFEEKENEKESEKQQLWSDVKLIVEYSSIDHLSKSDIKSILSKLKSHNLTVESLIK